MTKLAARRISTILRRNGYNPTSSHYGKRWHALKCQQSNEDVRVRVWSDILRDEPSEEDREVAAEIAALLAGLGYEVSHEAGSYYLYVANKKY